MHSAAWRYGTTSGCKKLEGRLNGLDADMQQPTACRKDEGRMPLREAAQLGVSGLSSYVAVKRAGVQRKEADWSAAARDSGKTHSRERDRETHVSPSGDAGVPAGHMEEGT